MPNLSKTAELKAIATATMQQAIYAEAPVTVLMLL